MSTRLKRLASLRTSCTVNEMRPLVTLEHLGSGTGKLRQGLELPERLPPENGVATAETGDVLFGKLRPYLAKTWLVDRPVFASSELLCLRPRPGTDSRWFAHVCSSHPVVEWATATSDGTKMPRTSWEKVSEYRCDVPSIAMQRAIGDYLDRETARIDSLIEKKRRMSDLLEERASVLISTLTAAGAVQEPSSLPDGWRFVPLRRCFASMDYGIGTPSSDAGAVHVLGMGNVEARRIVGEPSGRVDSVSSRLLLRDGDLLFNRTNSLALVGKVARWNGASQPTTFASYLVRLRVGALADDRYLNYLLNSREVLDLARTMALPSIGQANLNPNRYTSMQVPLPSPDRQRMIVDLLERELDVTDRGTRMLTRQTELLTERRRALVTAAVTGELDIPGSS